jgi:hypothetical protein
VQLERWNHGEVPNNQPQQQQQQQRGTGQEQEHDGTADTDAHKDKKQKCSHQQQPAYQYSLQLLVPPGHLELGRRLMTAMYSSKPDLSDLGTLQLIQLAILAECYGVGKVVAVVARHLQQLTVETISLAAAAALFELPEGCLAWQEFQGVQKTATDKLQRELGDLEVVSGNKEKEQVLLGLPLGALLALLGDVRTRVAYEDTAVDTVRRWLEQHSDTSSQQQQQLMGVLRLPHCTPTYLAARVAPAASWLRQAGLTEAEALGLCALPSIEVGQRMARVKWVFGNKAAWQLPPRPLSCMREVVISWDLPLSRLEDAVSSKTNTRLRPDDAWVTWCGRQWSMFVEADGMGMGLYLTADESAGFNGIYMVTATAYHHVKKVMANGCLIGSKGTGLPRVLTWGGDKEWPQVKEWLEQRQLVHPDGCLHLSIKVSYVC